MISRYKSPPTPPAVSVLTSDGVRVDEHGQVDNREARVFAPWETIHRLTYDGHGQALCWNNEEIRWRTPPVDEPEWTRRQTDVHVVRVLSDEDPLKKTLPALAGWRDWLAAENADPAGTTGSAAWSLLRGTMEPGVRLYLRVGDQPPFTFSSGGRIELAPDGRGEHHDVEHWDIPAAYASTLGNLNYGGRWILSQGPDFKGHDASWWSQTGHPTFVHARVRVPDLQFGPLYERPEKGGTFWQVFRVDPPFPRHKRLMHGIWTWAEIQTALEAGCRLERVYKTWVHVGGWPVFQPWWDAVQRGRAAPGLRGLLAKATGNALWGRFGLFTQGTGRTIVSKRGRAVFRQHLTHNQWAGNTDYALSETVAGIVRAHLTQGMLAAGDRVIAAHTDGLWVQDFRLDHLGWRRDRQAKTLQILEPQVFRWHPAKGGWRTVYAGQPRPDGERLFDEKWSEFLLECAP